MRGRALGFGIGALVLAMLGSCAKSTELEDSPAGGAGGAGAVGGASGAAGAGGSGGGGQAGDASAADAAGDSGPVNPCEGVTCTTPPANVCADAQNLTAYQPLGVCNEGQCSYASTATPCPSGCDNGACTGDPCIGVSCLTPPANTCASATHLTVHDPVGSCSAGTCTYTSQQVFCPNGCNSGACSGDPCVGISCTTPPSKYCTGANDLKVFDAPGTCTAGACQYSSHNEYCAFGCVNNACDNDPCAGVTCTTPPSNYCTNATTLRTHAATGTCSGGTCSYGYTDVTCPNGCANGKCVECGSAAPCPSGEWCNAGTCSTCNDDQHCGASCTNCAATGDLCNGAGTACVDCLIDSQCGSGNWCNAGVCAPCNTSQKCGPTCAACSGATPSCSGGACVCTPTSCGAYKQCSGGACLECNTSAACGSGCAPCGFTTPYCLDEGTTSQCVECLNSGHCEAPNVCTGNVCGAGCPLPTDACLTGSQSRLGCANARIIGRSTAGTPSGYSASPTTCSASNSMDVAGCSDSGNDHTYRLFLRQGEAITVTLSTGAECSGSSWFATLKIMTNAGCTSTQCSTNVVCDQNKSSSTQSYTAAQDGWYIVVVDSANSSNRGTYSLNVKLTCNVSGCEC